MCFSGHILYVFVFCKVGITHVFKLRIRIKFVSVFWTTEKYVVQPGIEPMPPAMEVWSPDHWTTRTFPEFKLFNICPGPPNYQQVIEFCWVWCDFSNDKNQRSILHKEAMCLQIHPFSQNAEQAVFHPFWEDPRPKALHVAPRVPLKLVTAVTALAYKLLVKLW